MTSRPAEPAAPGADAAAALAVTAATTTCGVRQRVAASSPRRA
ncbi:MAG TPA: hypothetical protein VFI47_31350 [Acidimicrobiales bacterium]|nr:hypothetical protein [Acidimicrobiales bacterium]